MRGIFIKKYSAGNEHFQIEKRYIRKDGSFVWGRLNVSPILDG